MSILLIILTINYLMKNPYYYKYYYYNYYNYYN